MVTYGNIVKNNFEIRIVPSDDNGFDYFALLNGLYLKNGGTHIDFIVNKITNDLRQKLNRKFKNIKPIDIKNSIKIYVNFVFFPNPQFDTQTKERLVNSNDEVKKFLESNKFSFDKLVKQILADDELISRIEDVYKFREKVNEIKTVKKNVKKKIRSNKYFPAIKNNEILFITEGDSATASLMNILSRKNFGYISMFGVPMNVWEEKISKISGSKKFEVIQQVCDVDYLKSISNCDYKYIAIATDADVAGKHIAALIIAYFYKFAKNIVQEKRLKLLRTPLILAFKGSKLVKWFYNFDEYHEFEKINKDKSIRYEYNKGLGSSEKEIMHQIIKTDGLNNMLETVEIEQVDEYLFDLWFRKDKTDDRKKEIVAKPFNINAL